MTRTRLLLLLLVVVVLLQVFPDRAALIELAGVSIGALYCAVWALAKFRTRLRQRARQAAQTATDDVEYRLYSEELNAIRAKYDPARDLSDPTSISQEYKDELSALHDRHEAMLRRKFGPRS